MRDPASPAGAAASDRAGQGDSPSWPSYSCQLSRPRGRRSAPLPAGARAALKGGSAGPVRVSRSAAAARSEERHGAAAGLLSTGARAAGGTVSAGRAHQPPRRGGRAGLRRGARHTGSKRASWGGPPGHPVATRIAGAASSRRKPAGCCGSSAVSQRRSLHPLPRSPLRSFFLHRLLPPSRLPFCE